MLICYAEEWKASRELTDNYQRSKDQHKMKNLNSDRISELSELVGQRSATPDLVYRKFIRNIPYNMNGVRGSLLSPDYVVSAALPIPFEKMDGSRMLEGSVKVKHGLLKVGTGSKVLYLQGISRVQEIRKDEVGLGIAMFSDDSELPHFLKNIASVVCYGVITDPVIYDSDMEHVLMVEEAGECCQLEAMAATDFDYVQDTSDLSRSYARKGDYLVLGTPGVISFLKLDGWEQQKAEVLEFSILRKAG